jgi:hypothetical protein
LKKKRSNHFIKKYVSNFICLYVPSF